MDACEGAIVTSFLKKIRGALGMDGHGINGRRFPEAGFKTKISEGGVRDEGFRKRVLKGCGFSRSDQVRFEKSELQLAGTARCARALFFRSE
jgi:hypothetical protein